MGLDVTTGVIIAEMTRAMIATVKLFAR